MLRGMLRALVPSRLRPKVYIVELVRKRTRMTVQQGPFAGMRFEGTSAAIPGLLGTYERELWPVIESLPTLGIATVINVGAADGYYAVGLARMLPSARIVAFETEERIRATLQRTIHLNAVDDRVGVRGKCELADLSAALQRAGAAIVVCDVEGYEEVLLNPRDVPALARSYVLVELHDFLVPGVSQTLRDRFTDSHEITVIAQAPRTAEDFPYRDLYLKFWPSSYRRWAVSERWDDQTKWFWMRPKAHGS